MCDQRQQDKNTSQDRTSQQQKKRWSSSFSNHFEAEMHKECSNINVGTIMLAQPVYLYLFVKVQSWNPGFDLSFPTMNP